MGAVAVIVGLGTISMVADPAEWAELLTKTTELLTAATAMLAEWDVLAGGAAAVTMTAEPAEPADGAEMIAVATKPLDDSTSAFFSVSLFRRRTSFCSFWNQKFYGFFFVGWAIQDVFLLPHVP